MAASGNQTMFTKIVFIVLLPLLLAALQVFASPSSQDFFAAAGGNDLRMVETLLKEGISPDAKDKQGAPALVRAAEHGAADVVLALLAAGADVNSTDTKGITALIASARGGHTAVVIALLDAGADPLKRDGFGLSALQYAEETGDSGNVAGILKEYGAQEKVRGEQKFAVVPVYFATNRRPVTAGSGADTAYGGEHDRRMHYGKCEVTIPADHLAGELEAPSVFRLEFRYDPGKHIVLKEVREYGEDEFFRKLQKESGPRDILLFIHGYNVTFDKAARRTAQLAYDLGFQGVPVFFSWPSQGELLGYAEDARQIKESIPDIERFLRTLIARFKPEKIHVIAHSMGTYGLAQALARISDTWKGDRGKRVIFNQVILAAPDIDGKLFREKIAPKMSPIARRVSLYASSHDLAMTVSHRFNSGRRAGDSNPEIVAAAGIESIDVSEVDTSLVGHSYYGSNRSIITDIRKVLSLKKPEEREYLEGRELQAFHRKYWFFNPGRPGERPAGK